MEIHHEDDADLLLEPTSSMAAPMSFIKEYKDKKVQELEGEGGEELDEDEIEQEAL